jgi:transglutaminase-like putative cysteine protease
MLRVRLTFRGAIAAALALICFLLGGALGHPYLNLSGYVLIGTLGVAGGVAYLALRGVRVRTVGLRRPSTGGTSLWVALEARRPAGPFGLDLDGLPEGEEVVRAPDRVGRTFHLAGEPPALRLRSLPLGLVMVMREEPIDWRTSEEGEAVPELLPAHRHGLSDPDGRVREHRPGEGTRHVHWPLSARLQRLLVRVRDHAPEDRARPALSGVLVFGKPADRVFGVLRACTLVATLGAIAFLWQQGALPGWAAGVLAPLVIVGGGFSLRRAGPPSLGLLAVLYVGILAIMAVFLSDLRAHVTARGPIALTVMGIAGLFAWDLRDRAYVRAQLFLVLVAVVFLPAFFPARDGAGSGIAYGVLLLALLLAAWADGRHAIGARRVRLSELGSLSSAILPLAFFGAIVLVIHPWLPTLALPSLPSFGLATVRASSSMEAGRVPGQEGRLLLDARWPQGNAPVLEVASLEDRVRTEVFDTYRSGIWSTSERPLSAWPVEGGEGRRLRLTLRRDAMRVLPMPMGARDLRDALLDPVRREDGTVRLSRPAWIGYSYEVLLAARPAADRTKPSMEEAGGGKGLSPDLGPLARQLAGEAATPLEAMERVASHLRSELRYDLQAPEPPAAEDPVRYFLEVTKRGSCLHFASALALLGRELGVPTRLIGGYAAGRRLGEGTVFEERHAHAWVEAYVEGRWVTLDPTPGGGSAWRLGPEWGRILLAIGLGGGLAVWLWRRARLPEGARRYHRMLERLRKLGVPITAATTPREALELARERLEPGAWEEFRELVARYESERFGGAGLRRPRAG